MQFDTSSLFSDIFNFRKAKWNSKNHEKKRGKIKFQFRVFTVIQEVRICNSEKTVVGLLQRNTIPHTRQFKKKVSGILCGKIVFQFSRRALKCRYALGTTSLCSTGRRLASI